VANGSRTAWTSPASAAEGRVDGEGRDVADADVDDADDVHPATDTAIVTTSAVQGERKRMLAV
jgi:uncharacterized protein YabE (DUF348 family)